ncbi:hypothetical protein GCM10027429_08550 [Marivirga atlantica]|jgi:hypothetical protein
MIEYDIIITAKVMKAIIPLQKSPSKSVSTQGLKVLLVGNNPIEMSKIYDQLKSLKERIAKIDISFDDRETLAYVNSHKPNCILIDDNYGSSPIKKLMTSLKNVKNNSASLTLLKTKNTTELLVGFQEYLMKESITADRLYSSLKNGLKFRKTRAYLKDKFSAK